MSDGVGFALLRVCGSVVKSLKTGPQIEKEVNEQLAEKSWSFTNYRGESTTVSIESITVRPKYSPKNESGGVQQFEPDNFFSSLEKERSKPNFSERLKAILKGQWITIARLGIEGDDAEVIRPPGLNVHYMTAHRVLRSNSLSENDGMGPFSVPAIRVSTSDDAQPDKLEMKFTYDGSLGQYRKRLHSGIDILKEMEADMDRYVYLYLMDLHHSGQIDNSGDFSWPTPEHARELGAYLVGGPVDLDALAEQIQETKDRIREVEYE